MVKVKFFHTSKTTDFYSEIAEFPLRPKLGEIVEIEGFLKKFSLKDVGISPFAQFRIIKLVWKKEDNVGVYLEATVRLNTKVNKV